MSGGHRRYVAELVRALSEVVDCIILSANGTEAIEGVREIPAVSAINESRRGVRRYVDRIRVYASQPRELESALETKISARVLNVCHFQQLPTLRPKGMIKAAKAAGFLTVVTVHNLKPHETGTGARAALYLARRAWRSADAVVVHSESLRAGLESYGGTQVRKIGVVPHPVWPVEIAAQAHPQRDFLFFGALRANKGILQYLEALAILGDPPATICGSGSSATVQEIERRIRALGLEHCHFRPGYVPEEALPALFGNHHLVVAPYTRFEAQSGVVHLAIAFRTPVVVTDVGALAEVVTEFSVGEVAAGIDEEQIARAMLIARTRSKAGHYRPGLERAAIELAPGKIALKLLDIYRDAAQAVGR